MHTPPASALSFIWWETFFRFFPNIVFYLCKYFFHVLHWMFLEKDFFNSSFQHPMPAYVRPSSLSINTHPSVYMFKHCMPHYNFYSPRQSFPLSLTMRIPATLFKYSTSSLVDLHFPVILEITKVLFSVAKLRFTVWLFSTTCGSTCTPLHPLCDATKVVYNIKVQEVSEKRAELICGWCYFCCFY